MAVNKGSKMENEELKQPDEASAVLSDITYRPGEYKLNSFDWLKNIPADLLESDIVEVRFKNTRKGFYRNVNGLRLEIGDVVAVEASPGHDIGRISLTGRLVDLQTRYLKALPHPEEMKKVYRKAKQVDIEKWEQARSLEIPTMLKSRKIAEDLGLAMKIGDVEYQGDKTKAIFYYIADERVDFRQLIRVLADEFRVRIEMRQIGARQEAGRIGGIGSCGRELCCSSYIKNFVSVTTAHAKYQELSLNPQKLAGQCSKLKCCLNYELDSYIDTQKGFPSKDMPLELFDRTVYFIKTEVYKGLYWYSSDPDSGINMTPVPVDRVREIQAMNKKGVKPHKLIENEFNTEKDKGFSDVVGNDSITRFENKKREKGKRRNKRKYRNNDRKGKS